LNKVCTVHTPDGAIHQFEPHQGMTVQDIFTQIPSLGVASNTAVLHAFGTTFAQNSSLTDIVSTNLRQPLLLSDSPVSTTPTPRDVEYESNNQHTQDVIDEIIRRHWENYDHMTCLAFGYVANHYTPINANDPIKTTLQQVKSLTKNRTLLGLADQILQYDQSSGSCSGGHYRLKEILSSKQLPNDLSEVLGKIKWMLRTGAKHTILTGTTVDNTLFVVDMGVNFSCIRVRPTTITANEKSILGCGIGIASKTYHAFRVEKDQQGAWQIEYRVRC